MFELTGKTALITGATGGIGRAIVKTLHAQGATVALTDINMDALKALAEELGERVFVYEANLADGESLNALVANAEKDMGKIDILVNNAGIAKDTLAMRMTDEQWDAVLQVNLTAAFKLSRAAMVGMMKRRYGRIISMASIVGAIGNVGQANYAASKAGLIAMSKSIGAELAGRGVTANCIAPGMIETQMTVSLPEEVKKAMLDRIPAKRMGQPQEIANVVAFLASEEAGYITGQTVHVNGGMLMM